MENNARKHKSMDVLRDDYYMVRKIAGGTFGMVYIVQRKRDKLMFAAKHLRRTQDEDRKYALRERDVLEKLKGGAHVMQIVDYFESSSQSVILTEFLTGGELFERISSKEYNLTEDKCREFIHQLLDAVSFLHHNRVIHLDLKPSNIVCVSRKEDNQDIKIIDFGLARDIGSFQSIPITACGTPEFMAPEVLKCSLAGPFSDMWSLGVVVFMLVTGGFSPFYSRNQYKMQRRILRAQYNLEHPAFENVTDTAKDFIQMLLIVNPVDRLTPEESLRHRWLEDVQSRKTLGQSEVTRLETVAMRRWLARRRWYRWYSAVIAVIRLRKFKQSNDINHMGTIQLSQDEIENEIWL